MSRRTMPKRRLPRATGPWALDSGGFSELKMFGGWRTSAADYAADVERYRAEVGLLQWAAPQDWMCEPVMVEKTGLSVREHQERTVANFLELRSIAPGLPFIPVLQGFTVEEYLRCWDLYRQAGIDLESRELVGLGSVCRRQGATVAEDIILALRPLRLHGFGCKTGGLDRYGYLLASADSLAWSYDAYRMCWKGEAPPCPHGKNSCANCLHYALAWRERLLAGRRPQQMHLEAVR